MPGIGRTLANGVRDRFLTPKEQEDRTALKQFIEMARLATLVTAVVATLLFAAFHNLFTLCLLGLVAYGCYETIQVINNAKEILDDAVIEATVRTSKDNIYQHMTKKAPIYGSLVTIYQPNVDRWLL